MRSWWALTVAAPIMLVDGADGVHAQTPREWFVMVVDIQSEIERADAQGRKLVHIDQEDRKFVRKMINDLTVSEDAMPTKAQATWLRKLKGWVEK